MEALRREADGRRLFTPQCKQEQVARRERQGLGSEGDAQASHLGARRWFAAMAILSLSVGSLPAQGGTRLGADLLLGRVFNAASNASGNLCLVDDSDQMIHCLDQDGRVRWSAGGKGDGPGEFRGLYRLALSENNQLFALDLARRTISMYSATGRHLRTMALPFGVSQVLSMLTHGEDKLVMTAKALQIGTASDMGIHVLALSGDSLVHLRSFGQLPVTESPEVANMFGSGILSVTSRGTLLYSQRFPYRIAEYSIEGRHVRTIDGPPRTLARPDDLILIERSATKTSYRPNPNLKGDRIALAFEDWNGRLVVLRFAEGGNQHFDIRDTRTGRWTSTGPHRSVGRHVLFDYLHRSLIVEAECNDEPCLMRLPLELDSAR